MLLLLRVDTTQFGEVFPQNLFNVLLCLSVRRDILVAINGSRPGIICSESQTHRIVGVLVAQKELPEILGSRIGVLCRIVWIDAQVVCGSRHQLHQADGPFRGDCGRPERRLNRRDTANKFRTKSVIDGRSRNKFFGRRRSYELDRFDRSDRRRRLRRRRWHVLLNLEAGDMRRRQVHAARSDMKTDFVFNNFVTVGVDSESVLQNGVLPSEKRANGGQGEEYSLQAGKLYFT